MFIHGGGYQVSSSQHPSMMGSPMSPREFCRLHDLCRRSYPASNHGVNREGVVMASRISRTGDFRIVRHVQRAGVFISSPGSVESSITRNEEPRESLRDYHPSLSTLIGATLRIVILGGLSWLKRTVNHLRQSSGGHSTGFSLGTVWMRQDCIRILDNMGEWLQPRAHVHSQGVDSHG